MVELLGTGDIFGEIGVMDGNLRTADAFADGNVRLLRIGAPVFIETLTTQAALGRNLCGMLAIRLRRTFALLQEPPWRCRLGHSVICASIKGGRDPRTDGRAQDGVPSPAWWPP